MPVTPVKRFAPLRQSVLKVVSLLSQQRYALSAKIMKAHAASQSALSQARLSAIINPRQYLLTALKNYLLSIRYISEDK